MAILRKAQCDMCDFEEWEPHANCGWPNWMILSGIVLDGVDSPMVCPECREPLMNWIDEYKRSLET